MYIKQLSIVLDDQSDTLTNMSRTLASHNVAVKALNITKSGKFTTVRIIVNNVLWASSALWEAGFTANLSDVLAAEIPDEPEGLTKILDTLDNLGITVKYLYTVSGKKTAAVMRTSDNKSADSAFAAAGIKTLNQYELSAL